MPAIISGVSVMIVKIFLIMAESEGFEPSIGDKPYTPLAGARLQPLGQLSKRKILYAKNLKFKQTV